MKDDNHSTFALLAMVAIVAIVGMVVMFMNMKTTAKESGTFTIEEAANALGDARARGPSTEYSTTKGCKNCIDSGFDCASCINGGQCKQGEC